MDDTKFPRQGLSRVENALSAAEADVSRVAIEQLGDVLRDFTLRGNSLPEATQRRLEKLLDSISVPAMAGRGMLRGYITLALHARFELRRDEAISFTVKALGWAKQSADASLIACAYKFLGAFHSEAGYPAEALHYLLQGLAALGESGTAEDRVGLLTTVGTVLIDVGQCKQALSACRRALAVTSDANVSNYALGVIYTNISFCYLSLGEYRNGLRAASTALALQDDAVRYGDVLGLELRNYFAARLFMETGQLEEAGRCLAAGRCMVDSRGADNTRSSPLIKLGEGMLMVFEGRMEDGLATIDEAVEEEIRRAPFVGVIESLAAAARAYEMAGRPDGARTRIKKAIEHTLALRRRRLAMHSEEALRILDADDDMPQLLADRGQSLLEMEGEVTKRKLQNMAALAELPEYPCARHAYRVGKLSHLLALQIGLNEDEAEAIAFAGRLHDIGKIGVPRNLLSKGIALSDIESEAIRTHTVNGEDLLSEYDGKQYRAAASAAKSHHERWDGSGYPDGLAGSAIPLAARIVALAETFDAMTHDRPWRKALPLPVVLDHIKAEAGRQFDPALVGPFVDCVERLQQQEPNLETFLSSEAEGSDLVRLQARLAAALRTAAR